MPVIKISPTCGSSFPAPAPGRIAPRPTVMSVSYTHLQKSIKGFIREYEEAGLKANVIVKSAGADMDVQIPSMDSEYKMGYHLTRELLREHPELTAIAGMNDMIEMCIRDRTLKV